MEYDVVIVGAGPAGLACAIRLKQLKPELERLRAREGLRGRRALAVRRGAWSPARWMRCCPSGANRRRRSACRRSATSSALLTRKPASVHAARRAAAAAQPRQLHHLARAADAVAGAEGGRPRRRCLRRLRRGRSRCSTTTARSRACASATWASTRDGEPGPNYTPGAEIRAKHDGARRRLPRQPRQAADRAVRARRGPLPADLRARHARSCGSCRPGACEPGLHPAHARLAAGHATPTAAASSITSTTTACTSATSSASTTRIRGSRRSRRSSSSSTIRACKPLLEGGEILVGRRAHHRRRRLAVDAEAGDARRAC